MRNTMWNAASTFRAAIKHNGRQFDKGSPRERGREREKERELRAWNFLSFLEPRTRCENLQVTCVHACTWLPGPRTRVISLSPSPSFSSSSVPCPPPPRSMMIALRTLRSSAETGKGKGHAMQLAVAVNDSEESKLRRGNKFKWARLIVQDKRV